MIYILNEEITQLLSDTELSEIQRAKMFNKHGEHCRILTLNFDEDGAANAKKHKVKTIVTNMFDFFQNVPKLKKPNPGHPNAYEIGLGREHRIDIHNGIGHVLAGDREDAKIYFTDNEQVSQVEWFDSYHNLVKTDIYDCRGFKSRELYYGNQGNLNQTITYDYKGNPVITENYRSREDGSVELTMIDCKYKGQELNFTTYGELYTFFVEQMMSKDKAEKYSIIAERPSLYTPLVNLHGDNVQKLYLLNNHTEDLVNEAMDAAINPDFDYLLQNKDQVDGIIVATKQQKQDIKKWMSQNCIKQDVSIYNASLGVVPNTTMRRKLVPIENRALNSFASVMAFYDTRHPIELIKAFQLVVKEYNNAHLDIYGYGDLDLRNRCIDLVEKLGLSDNIDIYDEANDLDNRLTDIIGYIDMADFDPVQPLGVMIALSHGTPVITRNMKYGTKELVRSGVNGYLMSSLDINQLAEKMIEFIQNQDKVQELSENAKKRIRHFGEDSIMEDWEKIFKKA